jgi:hypothetical protein
VLYENDLTVFDIQDFCANTLKNDATFEALCVEKVGSALNFETDAVLNDYDMLPPIPYCSIHAGAESQDLRAGEWNHDYEVAIVLGISDVTSAADKRSPSVTENGIVKYTSIRVVEILAKKAIITIKKRMASSGINGDFDIQLISANGTKTATGEADDMNYILSLTFSYLDTTSKGC